MSSRGPSQPKLHNFMKLTQKYCNLESWLQRHWKFLATGHIILQELETEHHSPASLSAIPIVQMPESAPDTSLGTRAVSLLNNCITFRGSKSMKCMKVSLSEQICMTSSVSNRASLARLGSQMLFKDLQWAVLAMHLFIFYSYAPYVGAISNISKLPFNHVLRCLFSALRYLLWLR